MLPVMLPAKLPRKYPAVVTLPVALICPAVEIFPPRVIVLELATPVPPLAEAITCLMSSLVDIGGLNPFLMES